MPAFDITETPFIKEWEDTMAAVVRTFEQERWKDLFHPEPVKTPPELIEFMQRVASAGLPDLEACVDLKPNLAGRKVGISFHRNVFEVDRVSIWVTLDSSNPEVALEHFDMALIDGRTWTPAPIVLMAAGIGYPASMSQIQEISRAGQAAH